MTAPKDTADEGLCPKCPEARRQGISCECGMPRAWTFRAALEEP